jgi:hypothetical protein
MLGPVLGQLIYTAVGYAPTFYAFALILSAALVVVIIIVPSNINFAGFDDAVTDPSIIKAAEDQST